MCSSERSPIRPVGRSSSGCAATANRLSGSRHHSGISQPAVSKHLGVLKLAGLVRDRRDGRQTHYSAEPQGLAPLIDWMSLYGAFWRDRFDRLETLLNRMGQ